jgi:hypothetical protein
VKPGVGVAQDRQLGHRRIVVACRRPSRSRHGAFVTGRTLPPPPRGGDAIGQNLPEIMSIFADRGPAERAMLR